MPLEVHLPERVRLLALKSLVRQLMSAVAVAGPAVSPQDALNRARARYARFSERLQSCPELPISPPRMLVVQPEHGVFHLGTSLQRLVVARSASVPEPGSAVLGVPLEPFVAGGSTDSKTPAELPEVRSRSRRQA